MKGKRDIFSVVLVLVLLVTSMGVFATEDYDKDNETIAYLVEDGIIRKLNHEELIDIENNLLVKEDNITQALIQDNKDESQISPRAYMVDYTFRKTSESKQLVSSKKRRVTPYVKGPMNIGMTFGSTVTRSITCNFGTSIETALKRTISVSGTVSKAESEAFNFGGSVPSGKTGYIQFTPRMAVIKGVATRTEYKNYKEYKTTSNATAYYPLKIGKYADGLYQIVYN